MIRIECYEDKRAEWRWRIRHRNGQILADSGEGYTRKRRAVSAARRLMQYGRSESLEVVTLPKAPR